MTAGAVGAAVTPEPALPLPAPPAADPEAPDAPEAPAVGEPPPEAACPDPAPLLIAEPSGSRPPAGLPVAVELTTMPCGPAT